MRKLFLMLAVVTALTCTESRSAWSQVDEEALMQKLETLENKVKELEAQLGGEAVVSADDKAPIVGGIEISGGISTNSVWNFDSPDSGSNGLRVFDTDSNSAGVDIVEVALAKNSESGLGGRIDLNFLKTAGVIASAGTDSDDFDVQQAYITYTSPLSFPCEGLSIKLGKFVTPLGAEVIEPWDNWNFSRSLLFGYAIPFTHVGITVSKSFTDYLSLTAGVVNGWDNVSDNNDGKSFLGNVTLGPWEWFTLGINGIVGPEQADENGNVRGVLDLVLTAKPTPIPQLTLMFNYDYGTESDVPSFEDHTTITTSTITGFSDISTETVQVGASDATWQGFAGYAKYDFTDRLYAAIRGEWFSDEDGARTGTSQDLWEITVTGAYMFVEGLWGRLEYRHDDSNATPFLDGDSATDTQNTISTEVLYIF